MARMDFDWSGFDQTVTVTWSDGKEYDVRKFDALTLADNEKALCGVGDDASDEDKIVALADYLLDEAGFPVRVCDMPLAFRAPFFKALGIGTVGES